MVNAAKLKTGMIRKSNLKFLPDTIGEVMASNKLDYPKSITG
jgi:hypothetical protein